MNYERSVISEARLLPLAALTCVPIIIMVVMTVGLLSGWGPNNGMYYRAFGPIVYVFFYAGLSYATYEFANTMLKKREYISVAGSIIYILYYQPIKISEISEIYLEKGLISDNIVISKLGKEKVKIRAYLLKGDMHTVLKRLKALTE